VDPREVPKLSERPVEGAKGILKELSVVSLRVILLKLNRLASVSTELIALGLCGFLDSTVLILVVFVEKDAKLSVDACTSSSLLLPSSSS
jgi:hypothetical protein